MGTMLGWRSVRPTRPSRTNRSRLHAVLAEAVPQHFQGHEFLGLPVGGPIHPGECAVADWYRTR